MRKKLQCTFKTSKMSQLTAHRTDANRQRSADATQRRAGVSLKITMHYCTHVSFPSSLPSLREPRACVLLARSWALGATIIY